MTPQRSSTVDYIVLVKGLLCFLTLVGNISSNPVKLSNNTSLVKCSMLHKSSACFVESSDTFPVNKTGGITVMQPEFGNIEFYINKTNVLNKIYLKLEWSQKTSYIKKYVTGYYIHINYQGNTVGNGFKVNLNFDKIPTVSKKIHFVFDEYGEKFEHLIYRKSWYQVSLSSLPIFNVADHTEWDPHISRNVTSPDCPSKSKLDVFWPGCNKNNENEIKKDFVDYYDSKDYDEIEDRLDDESIETHAYKKSLRTNITIGEIDYPDIEGSDYTQTIQAAYNNTTAIIIMGILLVAISVLAVNIYIKRDVIRKSFVSKCCQFDQNTESGSQKQLLEDGSEQIIVITSSDNRDDKQVQFTQYLASNMSAAVTGTQEVSVDCNLWALNTSKDTKLWLCDVIEQRNFDSVSLLVIGSNGCDEKLLEYRDVARKSCDVTKIRICRGVVFTKEASKRSFKMSRSKKCYELPWDLDEMLDNLTMTSLSSKVTLQMKKLSEEVISCKEAV